MTPSSPASSSGPSRPAAPALLPSGSQGADAGGSAHGTTWWTPEMVDRSVVAEREVAVIGFDPAAELHAQNLRDSGVDVRIGAPEGGPEHAAAVDEGFFTLPVADAVQDAEAVVTTGAHLAEVGPVLTDDHLLVLTSAAAGRALRASRIRHRGMIVLVELLGEPEATRQAYVDGRGAPAVVSVVARGKAAGPDLLHRWATRIGQAPAVPTTPEEAAAVDARADALPQQLAVAYADALGATRAAGIEVDALDWAAAADHADTRVTPLLEAVLAAGRDDLVARGFDPVVADLAVVHRLEAELDRLRQEGIRPSAAGPRREHLVALIGSAPASHTGQPQAAGETDEQARERHLRLRETFGGTDRPHGW